ncbi:MAG: phage holin family protein [Bacteroidales bacterium]|nr:phage holin family protein [Bacteroidales bacterium]
MSNKKGNYEWSYCSLGGVVRVNIQSGEDIAHLDELDQKLWTVLSCPVSGLEFDETTFRMLDTDSDGKIRVPEIIAAAKWLTSVIKNKDLILKGDSVLPLDQIDTSNPAGARLERSAKQILSNLKLNKKEISVEEASDSVAIFAETGANGDGVITEASARGPELKEVIATIAKLIGSAPDRSGVQGVTAEGIETFYAALADYSAWMASAGSECFPFGDDTPAALAALNAIKDKAEDFFMRCKLIAFSPAAAPVLGVTPSQIEAIGGGLLSGSTEEIAAYPLAIPSASGVLGFDSVNPAWKGAVEAFRKLNGLEGKDGISEAEWKEAEARFNAYTAWMAAKKGEAVEPLGIDKVNALLAAGGKTALLDLVTADKALEEEANAIDEVSKLMHLYRDFYKLLKNYVILSDFYSPDREVRAVFEAGDLYIDQRCCRLCVRVSDLGKHADMSSLSGMFILYCHCRLKGGSETMDILAVMTDGGTRNLRPGTNGVFYDREGRDWDATVTRIVENPISLKQAFWSPYIKFWNFCKGLLNKSVEEKDGKALAELESSTSTAVAAPAAASKPQPFDIAKFAGIFAALGMALGLIGSFCTGLVKGVASTPWWGLLLIIAGIMLVISGPACFIAWGKLRRRNLGPVLNANGWAVNSVVLVNIPFGRTLTSVAKYPRLKLDDPYAPKTPLWRKVLRWFLAIAIVTLTALFFSDNLKCIGLPFHKEKPAAEAPVAEAPAEAAGTETAAVETPAEPAAEETQE